MIPDFLKPENRKELDELEVRFGEAVDRYHEHFKNDRLNTEPSVWTQEEWIAIIDACIEENKTVRELLGEEDDDPEEDWYY